MRVGPGRRRAATGSLYAMGLNFSITGVFYNKKLAAQIGMTRRRRRWPSSTRCWPRPRQAGITPDHAVQRRRDRRSRLPAAETHGLLRPDRGPINDWIFQKPGATIDTPANLKAAQHLQQWIKAGYFAEGRQRASTTRTMMAAFIGGKGLFMFNGDWESGNLDKQMPGNVGFFLMPPAEARAASTPRCRRR